MWKVRRYTKRTTREASSMGADLREIPRELEAGELSEEETAAISKAVFYAPPAKPSDLIFMFGNSRGDWTGAAMLYASGYAPLVLASGRSGLSAGTVEVSQA